MAPRRAAATALAAPQEVAEVAAAITSEITWIAMGVTWLALVALFVPLSAQTLNPLKFLSGLGLVGRDE